jgi:hypothetical protein
MIYVNGLTVSSDHQAVREDAGPAVGSTGCKTSPRLLLLLRLGVTWPRNRVRYPSYLATGLFVLGLRTGL